MSETIERPLPDTVNHCGDRWWDEDRKPGDLIHFRLRSICFDGEPVNDWFLACPRCGYTYSLQKVTTPDQSADGKLTTYGKFACPSDDCGIVLRIDHDRILYVDE